MPLPGLHGFELPGTWAPVLTPQLASLCGFGKLLNLFKPQLSQLVGEDNYVAYIMGLSG